MSQLTESADYATTKLRPTARRTTRYTTLTSPSNPMAERWRYNNGDHPSTCTCVPCTEARVERARKARADEKPGPLAPILDPLRTFLDRLARAFR